jgi:hypothetical protein
MYRRASIPRHLAHAAQQNAANHGTIRATPAQPADPQLPVTAGYGYGVDAPRRHGFGGHEIETQFEFKY